jgi:putative phosphoesterase
MLIGIISDVHGNETALKAVLDEMPDTDLILLAGDIAGRAVDLKKIFDIIDENNVICIKGNHEDMAVLYFDSFGKDEETGRLVERINDTPSSMELVIDGKRIFMAHGSPWNTKSEYIYPEYGDFKAFETLGYKYFVLGHTHVPMIVKSGDVTIINPGSVGEPQAGDPRPSFALLDTESDNAEIRYVKNYVEEKKLRFITPFRWKSYDIRLFGKAGG